jgi:chloramphenicol 3-O-phosphotransferase
VNDDSIGPATDRAPVVVLNAASSAGKTIIARALQEQLARPPIHLSEVVYFDMTTCAPVGAARKTKHTLARGRPFTAFVRLRACAY